MVKVRCCSGITVALLQVTDQMAKFSGFAHHGSEKLLQSFFRLAQRHQKFMMSPGLNFELSNIQSNGVSGRLF